MPGIALPTLAMCLVLLVTQSPCSVYTQPRVDVLPGPPRPPDRSGSPGVAPWGGSFGGFWGLWGTLGFSRVLHLAQPHSPPPPPWVLLQDFQSLRYIDGLSSSFQFFLPLGAGGALHLPPTAFLPPSKEKRLPPELPLPKQLICRWSKVSREGWGGRGRYGTVGWGFWGFAGACRFFMGLGVVIKGWEHMQGHCEDRRGNVWEVMGPCSVILGLGRGCGAGRPWQSSIGVAGAGGGVMGSW